MNDQVGSLFVSGIGLKQGDHLPPILFNLVAHVFSIMLLKASLNNINSTVIPHVVYGGIISLQYADETLLFFDPSI